MSEFIVVTEKDKSVDRMVEALRLAQHRAREEGFESAWFYVSPFKSDRADPFGQVMEIGFAESEADALRKGAKTDVRFVLGEFVL